MNCKLRGMKRELESNNDTPLVSLVVPVFNEENNIRKFVEVVRTVFSESNISSYEIVFVDDGSTDNTWQILERFSSVNSNLISIKLAQNVGKENALTAGLRHASGRVQIPIDVDLQDPPSLIPIMLEEWQNGADVVLAKRRTRAESLAKSLSAKFYYWLISVGSGGQIPQDVGDFRLMDSAVTRRFLALRERNRFNKGLLAFVSSKEVIIEFDRPKGREDKSRHSFLKLLKLGSEGIVSFTTFPLRIVSVLGIILLLTSIFGTILSLVLWSTGVLEVPGQTTVIVMILFLAGFQALSIGILGEYVASILSEVKNRPLYFVSEVIGKPNQFDSNTFE